MLPLAQDVVRLKDKLKREAEATFWNKPQENMIIYLLRALQMIKKS